MKDPFPGYAAEYQEPLTEQNKTELKGFFSQRNAVQWLLEMHEFILLALGCPHATDRYKPFWSVKEAMQFYMDNKEVEVPDSVEENFPEIIQLSQILEVWKYVVTSKQKWMNHE
ncbi:hypothetical protein ILYODFUR_031187 [Ilyodon furcidens]|uniref:Uncharacterized protein n=1 Tax=Ilyodon furcidens TaxID=33524 RepID=A0ABV0SQM5_9TELE